MSRADEQINHDQHEREHLGQLEHESKQSIGWRLGRNHALACAELSTVSIFGSWEAKMLE